MKKHIYQKLPILTAIMFLAIIVLSLIIPWVPFSSCEKGCDKERYAFIKLLGQLLEYTIIAAPYMVGLSSIALARKLSPGQRAVLQILSILFIPLILILNEFPDKGGNSGAILPLFVAGLLFSAIAPSLGDKKDKSFWHYNKVWGLVMASSMMLIIIGESSNSFLPGAVGYLLFLSTIGLFTCRLFLLTIPVNFQTLNKKAYPKNVEAIARNVFIPLLIYIEIKLLYDYFYGELASATHLLDNLTMISWSSLLIYFLCIPYKDRVIKAFKSSFWLITMPISILLFSHVLERHQITGYEYFAYYLVSVPMLMLPISLYLSFKKASFRKVVIFLILFHFFDYAVYTFDLL
jgi:hypothetical protein